MITFLEYVDKKQRDAVKQLKIVNKLLKHAGFQTASHVGLKMDDPYVFLYNTDGTSRFGLRIFQIGGKIAYRIQKKEKTQPYGKAYSLDIEQMFDDIKEDGKNNEEAVQELVKSVKDEITSFFKKSEKAEKEARRLQGMDSSPLGAVAMRSTGTDYANTVLSKQ